MSRITLAGAELHGFDIGLPASSVRLLLPQSSGELVLPIWDGNQFLFAEGGRPIIRTLTPVRFDPASLELDVEIVRHGHGPLSTWAELAKPGAQVAISGTGRGYEIAPSDRNFLLLGDESALPAIGVLLIGLPALAAVQVVIEVSDLSARFDLPAHAGATVEWNRLDDGALRGTSLITALSGAQSKPDLRIWAAGEAASMQRIRRHLFDELGLPRSSAVVRGYWKHGAVGS